MKTRYSHKHVPPPRTLVPRILAALAAGAVTLGALPAAYPDPAVASTVTTDTVVPDGVAGSVNDTTATIKVGTSGGGTSPEVYYMVGTDKHYAPVSGAWRQIAATDGTINFKGTALINSGRLGSVMGAYA